jgi:hypothetical protein
MPEARMLKRINLLLIIVCMLLGQTSCNPLQVDTQATETVFQAETQQAQSAKTTRQAQFTANAQATIRAAETIQFRETQKAEQATAAVDTTGTAEAQATQAAYITATAKAVAAGTAEVFHQQTVTAEANKQATARAEPMLDLVTSLAGDGYLSTTQGIYYPLLDFDESWAQLGWYWFFPTGFSPTDFVFSAHTEWDSAIRSTEAETTGCGIVFRENGEDNHYLVYLSISGNVYFARNYKQYFTVIGQNYYGPVGEPPQGQADIVLAVEGNYVTFLVNGEKVLRQYDEVFSSGSLDYTLISGTNKDYGTHCRMTNVKLWVIK